MIKSFGIKENSTLSKILCFNNPIELKQVTLLFGGNSVGKSSLINAIKKQDDITADITKSTSVYTYINSQQNFRELKKNPNITYEDTFKPELHMRRFAAEELSEGQSIIYSLQDIFRLCKKLDKKKDHIILLDEIDSGLSVENVDYLAKEIKMITEKCPHIQFVIAFNNYVFCRTFKEVFNMYTGEWITINSFDEYYDTIMFNKEMLLKKRRNNMFTGKSFYLKEE